VKGAGKITFPSISTSVYEREMINYIPRGRGQMYEPDNELTIRGIWEIRYGSRTV
jgi:hypothetical protein